jgi:hypothetical protein
MQWSPATRKSKRINTRKVSVHNNNVNNNNKRRGQSQVIVRCIHISVALQQQAAGFKVAILHREMQWSNFIPETEEVQKN